MGRPPRRWRRQVCGVAVAGVDVIPSALPFAVAIAFVAVAVAVASGSRSVAVVVMAPSVLAAPSVSRIGRLLAYAFVKVFVTAFVRLVAHAVVYTSPRSGSPAWACHWWRW